MADRLAGFPVEVGRVHAELRATSRARSSAPCPTAMTPVGVSCRHMDQPPPGLLAEACPRDEPNLDTSRGPAGENRRGLVDFFLTGLPPGDERH